MSNTPNNSEIQNLPRKNDDDSKTRRSLIIQKMSYKQLENQLSYFKQEIDNLEKINKKIKHTKEKFVDKSKSVQNEKNESNSDIKIFKSFILGLENSKYILINIQNENTDITSGYSKTTILKESTNQDYHKLIKDKVKQLLINSEQKINSLPEGLEINSLKNLLLKYSDNLEFLIESMSKLKIKNNGETDYPLLEPFNYLSNLGTVLSNTHYNQERKLEKNLNFLGNEGNTAWREINNHNKEELALSIKNFFEVFQVSKNENLDTISSSIIEFSKTFESVITAQIKSLSKKETEMGIKNTLFSILTLIAVYSPFLGIGQQLEINNRVKIFKENILKFSSNIKILRKNIEEILQNIDISNNEINENLFSEGIKLLVNSFNFSYIEKKDLLYLKGNFDGFINDALKLKMYSQKLQKVGFTIENFQVINESNLSYLPQNLSSNSKRNFTTSSQLFEFFSQNSDYVSVLNQKIFKLSIITQLEEIILQKTKAKELIYLDVVEMIINNMTVNELSANNINLVTFFLKIIVEIKRGVEDKKEIYSKKSDMSQNTGIMEAKDLLEITLNEIISEMTNHRFNHQTKSNIEIDKNYSFENLRSLIPIFQREVQTFIFYSKNIIIELDQEMNNRLTKPNTRNFSTYSAPGIRIENLAEIKDNNFLSTGTTRFNSEIQLQGINKDNKPKDLNSNSVVDIRQTRVDKIDLKEIMKSLNLNLEDKKNTDK